MRRGKYVGLHLMHLDYLKKYGKVYATCLGSKPSLIVADPELLKQIMIRDFPNFRNRYIIQRGVFDKSVLNVRDETWKRIRNTLTPTFSAGKMKVMVPLIEKSCDTLMHKLDKIADSGERRNTFLLICFLLYHVMQNGPADRWLHRDTPANVAPKKHRLGEAFRDIPKNEPVGELVSTVK